MSLLCLLPFTHAFRSKHSEQAELETEQEVEQETVHELDVEVEHAEGLEYKLGEIVSARSDADEELDAELGGCRKGMLPLAIGGVQKTYKLPKTGSGKSVPLQCAEGLKGEIVMQCKGSKWAVGDMGCSIDRNVKKEQKTSSSAQVSTDKVDKCYALCLPNLKTKVCGVCTHKQQCESGAYCCPYLKRCLKKGGTKDKCGNYQKLSANCKGCGKTAKSPEDPTCTCTHADWPKKWLGKCTNSPAQYWKMCGDVITSPSMKR